MTKCLEGEESQREQVKALRLRTLKPEREGAPWTIEEKEMLNQLFNDYVGITMIALTLNRTETAVVQKLSQMDLFEKIRRNSRCKCDKCLCEQCELKKDCPRLLKQ